MELRTKLLISEAPNQSTTIPSIQVMVHAICLDQVFFLLQTSVKIVVSEPTKRWNYGTRQEKEKEASVCCDYFIEHHFNDHNFYYSSNDHLDH